MPDAGHTGGRLESSKWTEGKFEEFETLQKDDDLPALAVGLELLANHFHLAVGQNGGLAHAAGLVV